MASEGSVAISAPGKVLLAGGYLVVDRAHTGLVFGLDARIHVHVQTLPTSPGVSLSEIIVRSPQFRDADWRYGYRLGEKKSGYEVVQLKGHSSSALSQNRFVQTALAYALSYVSSHSNARIGPALVTIIADADYYSAGLSRRRKLDSTESASKEDSNKRFIDFDCSLQNANKTGLGSSAALVTAFTAAIVGHYLPATVPAMTTDIGKARLHNLAQAAHCTAQGKIGSGFDVAAAVYGSCIYRRFSPSILEKLGDVGMTGFAERLQLLVDDTESPKLWDTEIDKSTVRMPKGLRLVMCDVDCGSETPGMVKKVFQWRKENPEEATLLWMTLQRGNEDLIRELRRLASEVEEGKTVSYQNLREIILTIRSLIREMSVKAGVPIEPTVQTQLLDACSALPGVIGGVVPGAGGFDAVVLILEDKDDVLEGLESFLKSYKSQESGDEGEGKIERVRLLGVKQEMEGIRTEDISLYRDWINLSR
ncbi:phosphomevalonate kinase [Agyrium rufum]|nr:phosphomevalonate kinase [Agyrium rufum]